MNGYIVYHESTFMVYIYFRGYSRNANYAKICTAQKCLGSQYLPAHEVVVISYNEQISLMAHGQRVASHRGNRTRFCPRQHRPRQRCIRGNLRNGPQIPNLSLPYHKSYKSNIYKIIMSEIEATLCLPKKYS